jgi:hypothetical protein
MLKRNSIYNRTAFRRLLLIALFAIVLINITLSTVSGQKSRNETPPLKERLFYGGSLGLQFGTYTDIDVSPVIGLWVLPRLNVAVGPKYRYQKYYDERANMYGGRAYSQFFFIRDLNNLIPMGVHLGLFLHAEDEFFRFYYTDGTDSEELFSNTPLIGAGISEPLGRRASLNLMFLWALDDPNDFYDDPEIRFSIIF